MKISIRKKSLVVLGLVMSTALLCNQSCDINKQIVIVPEPKVNELLIDQTLAISSPNIAIIQENQAINQDAIIQLSDLIADLFEGKNPININESITNIIQKGQDIILNNRPTFDAYRSKERIDKILSVFEKIKVGIRSGYFYNDSKWCGKLPGPRLQEMADLLKEFVEDLPAATKKRLTVSKLQQLAMLQVLIKRLALEQVSR